MIEFTIPLRTVSALNEREHFRVRAKRVKNERAVTAASLERLWKTHAESLGLNDGSPPAIACVGPLLVTLTRVGPRKLDRGDNLGASLKGVRDELAAWLGVDDGDESAALWEYAMERGAFAVRVRIEPLPAPCVTCGAHRAPLLAPEPMSAAEVEQERAKQAFAFTDAAERGFREALHVGPPADRTIKRRS
jgi:hypothetical protein